MYVRKMNSIIICYLEKLAFFRGLSFEYPSQLVGAFLKVIQRTQVVDRVMLLTITVTIEDRQIERPTNVIPKKEGSKCACVFSQLFVFFTAHHILKCIRKVCFLDCLEVV